MLEGAQYHLHRPAADKSMNSRFFLQIPLDRPRFLIEHRRFLGVGGVWGFAALKLVCLARYYVG